MKISDETLQEIKLLLKRNQKLKAVVLVREETKCSLKEAKDYVEQLGTTSITPVSAEKIDQQLRTLLSQSKKLEAIKLYKDHSGAGLAESKNYVERLVDYSMPQSARTHSDIDRILKEQANSQRSSPIFKWVLRYLAIILLIALIRWLFTR